MTDRSPLDRISIASPCSADWNQMQGDDRRRFCGECRLHVHDLSRMSEGEAAALLQQAGPGRVCVRFYRRADGRVLTRDCPVGLRQKLRWAVARAIALWLCVGSAVAACVRPRQEPAAPGTPPSQPAPLQGEVVMGDVAVPTVPPTPLPLPDPGAVEMGRVRVEPK